MKPNVAGLESVSVVIPTYNRAGLVQRAINSVLAAMSDGDELLVVDDGSTDDTLARLSSFGTSIRVIAQSNRGQAAARNVGLLAAKHDLVAFLDSDDEWTPDKLDLQRALVLFLTLAAEDANVDDRAFDTRRAGERGIANIAGLFAEDSAQQLLFRSELGFALGRYLAYQNVVVLDLGADADDSAFVQVTQRRLGDVRNIARDLFRSQLGIASFDFELHANFKPARGAKVVETLNTRPEMVHVILTGRNAHPSLVAIADTVTEMREVKHAYQKGILAQRGIEY